MIILNLVAENDCQQAIKDYFRSKPDNRKLLKYGKAFGIVDKIRTYMEVLS